MVSAPGAAKSSPWSPPAPRHRLLVTAVGFAIGLPIKAFATRDEALAHLRA